MVDQKQFTPYEATRSLPLVKRIVADILGKGQKWKSLTPTREGYLTPETELELADLKDAISDHLEELAQIGCSFRDNSFEIGLVDFPSTIEGRKVLLCWKSDEETLEWYHGLHDGFAGRKKIPLELLTQAPS
jgi:hypothetical protein